MSDRTPRTAFTPLSREARHRPLCIAHRGASAYAPENSPQAFTKAAELGADMVEVDVRLTADDVPVLLHDETLRRTFGIDRALADMRSVELPADLPTFAAAAELCADLRLGMYLDIKRLSRRAAQNILSVLVRTGLEDQVIFGTFMPDIAAELKAAVPRARTSILFSAVSIDPVALARAVNADYVHPCWENAAPEPHKLLTSEWMAAVRGAGLGILCWHEERPLEMAALRDLGVDAICSDTPDVLARVLSSAPF